MTADKPSHTILLVDDDKLVRRAGKRMLERFGYEVLLAENGQVAVDLYREQGELISLVILDLVMPVMDGSQAFVELKKLDPNVIILIASGYLRKELCDELVSLGAAGLVEKPYDSESLPDEIQWALVGKK